MTAREAAQRRADLARARHWRRRRMAGLEALKAQAVADHDFNALAAAASELRALQWAGGAGLIDLWRTALRDDPEGAAECERWGAEDEAFSAALTGTAVAILAEAEHRKPIYQPPPPPDTEAA